MPDAYKRMEVCDLENPDRMIIFERPSEDSSTVVITQNFTGSFHLDAGTLELVGKVMNK